MNLIIILLLLIELSLMSMEHNEGLVVKPSTVKLQFLVTRNDAKDVYVDGKFFLLTEHSQQDLQDIFNRNMTYLCNYKKNSNVLFNIITYLEVTEHSANYCITAFDENAQVDDHIKQTIEIQFQELISDENDICNLQISKTAKLKYDKAKKTSAIQYIQWYFKNTKTGKKGFYDLNTNPAKIVSVAHQF